MPGPLSGESVLKLAEFPFKGGRIHLYMSAHTKCEKGAACTGPGCRANTGKTAIVRGRNVKGK